MLTRLYSFAERHATGRNILMGIALIVVFNVLLGKLPAWRGSPHVFDGTGIPDLWYSYEGDYLQRTVGSWSEEGRAVYSLNALLVDNLYALTYAITYILLLWWLFGKAFPRKNWWKPWAVLLPLFAALMDWIENFSISRLCHVYPEMTVGVSIAPWATWLKWNVAAAIFLLVLVGGVGALVRRQ